MEKGLSSGQRTETVWMVVAGIVQLVVAEMVGMAVAEMVGMVVAEMVGMAPAVVALVQCCQ